MIDYFANRKDSRLHTASALSKVIATLIVIASVVMNSNLRALIIILGIILLTVRISKLPLGRILKWGIYPVVFAAVFAIGIFVRDVAGLGVFSALHTPAVLMLRSLCAALSLILLLSTTPYTQVFALSRRFLPELIVGTMILTYRFFFILIDELDNLMRVMRLKGGGLSVRKIIDNLGDYGRIVGVLLIRSIDLSERMYKIFLVRGYRGVFSMGEETRLGPSDVYPLTMGFLIMAVSLKARGMF